MIKKLNTLIKSKLGQGMTEWILIVSLIAIGSMVAFTSLQEKISESLGKIGPKISESVK
ncbi:MAG: Flp family type IVb pilin [Candidatus Magnetomorum sp.]|nr:Flp family type IVb pilin [Candidatus Magnetomorum sp.]MBF0451167.1 Flp family type IVb pilin [Candidatus Magnetomorum sp.]